MSDHTCEKMEDAPYCKHCGLQIAEDKDAYEPRLLSYKEALKLADKVLLSKGYVEVREM